MSRTSEVLRKRRGIENEIRKQKNEELSRLRNSSSFRAKAFETFKDIGKLLNDDSVKSIIIEIDNKDLANFGSMLMDTHELDVYNIRQLRGEPNKFEVSKKYISI